MDEQTSVTHHQAAAAAARPSLGVTLCGVPFRNPTVLASGILGLSQEVFDRLANLGIGAITTKSCSLQPRVGWHNPTIVNWGHGLINAVGLSNPGVEVMVEEIRTTKAHLSQHGVPIIASIFANTIYDFGTLTRYISEAEPDLIEVNISCPNLDTQHEEMFSSNAFVSAQVTRMVKRYANCPVIIKLSPNVENIGNIAREVVNAGADAICAINSLGPGIVLDIDTARPILANRTGGVSGPAIRPIAVRCVYDISRAVSGTKAQIIGTGGITDARDAIEMILVGATCVGIGSAVYHHGYDVFADVCMGIEDYMQRHGYSNIEEFRGLALS
ncbi:MAG: dihydroorotate dehydrogenase [Chloroflexi bacterium]|nr:dihydroorotate dehydrogenase [Chloroflexota bacterium]MCL5273867.1 dihydroorotate dehydrogenase [Chloroflexota bacterium]